MGTGSEVSLCVEAHGGSKPTASAARREYAVVGAVRTLLPRASGVSRTRPAASLTARVSVERGSTLGWARYVGVGGAQIGMETFGASAPLAGTAEEIRLYARAHRRCRAAADGTGEVTMRIAIGSDHAGFELKESLKLFLADRAEVLDVGTYSSDAVDYADYASAVGTALREHRADRGIICVRQRRRCVDGREPNSRYPRRCLPRYVFRTPGRRARRHERARARRPRRRKCARVRGRGRIPPRELHR